MAAQVQVNLRVPAEVLARVECARGSGARNGWLLAAVEEKLAREELFVVGVPPDARVVSRPVGVGEDTP